MKIHECYRKPVTIRKVSEAVFNRDDRLDRTYRHKPSGAVITNDHSLLFYWVKRWQMEGKLAATDLQCIHVDYHLDLGNPEVMPPARDQRRSMGRNLAEFWKYTSDRVAIWQPFVPLVFDGSLSGMFFIRENEKAGGFEPVFTKRVFKCYPGPDREGSGEDKMWFENATDVPELPKHLPVNKLSFHRMDFNAFRIVFGKLFEGIPRNQMARRTFLSIDVDCFMKENSYDPHFDGQIKDGEYFLNERAVRDFRALVDSIRGQLKGMRMFICTSTPVCTHPLTARIILDRLEEILLKP